MKLFLLENESTLDGLFTSPEYTRGRDIIICFNYLVVIKLRQQPQGHTYLFCEDFLTSNDYLEINDFTDRVALNWYQVGADDRTLYHGVSFGYLVRGALSRSYMLPVLVKYGEVIRRVLTRWPSCQLVTHDFSGYGISAFISDEENSSIFNKGRLVLEVCSQLGVEVRHFCPESPLLSAFMPPTRLAPGMTPRIKMIARKLAVFLEALANYWGAATQLFGQRRRRIYFYNYGNLNSILNHVSSRFVLRTMVSAGLKVATLYRGLRYVDFRRESYSLQQTDCDFISRLHSERVNFSKNVSFTLNGIGYEKIYLPAIDDLVHRVIPGLVAHVGKVRKALRKYNIGVVIDIDMLSEESKALVAACKLERVKTVHLDHGIMGHRKAMEASALEEPDIVIGPGMYDSYNHLARRVVLGNPAMDPYPRDKRKAIKSIARVLFLTFEDNFYARLDRFAYQEKYYEEIFSIFPKLQDSGIEIYYKPHPGESRAYHEYLFRFFNLDTRHIRYIQLEKFSAIIRDMDLVVSNVSSCYYEALAAGVPTIFMEPHFIKEALCPPLNGCHGVDVLRAENGKELLSIIKTHQAAPTFLNQFVSNFLNNQAPLYMGELDGLAGKRIVDYVSSLD